MKIIEALRQVKDLKRKASDIREKTALYCSDLDCDTPTYINQRSKISEWLQAHGDIIKEINRLQMAILNTNLKTEVSIVLGGKTVTKSIIYWINRRKDLAKLDEQVWSSLYVKSNKEEYRHRFTPQAPEIIIKPRLYFDPEERDKMVEMYRSEPSLIDSTLEIINATTDLIE